MDISIDYLDSHKFKNIIQIEDKGSGLDYRVKKFIEWIWGDSINLFRW